MAELTNLESKLGEVLGLAMAAQTATEKVLDLVEDDEAKKILTRMNGEAAKTEERVVDLAGGIEGKKTAILEKARETKSKASDMLSTYLDDDADALDGFEFLTMAEAGEVGHWKVLRAMSERAGQPEVVDLVGWAIPIQERHLSDVAECSVALAANEDPNEEAS